MQRFSFSQSDSRHKGGRGEWYRSPLLTWAAAALVVVMLAQFGRAMVKRYEIAHEVKQLQADIHSYQQKNVELKQVISYLESPDFQERQAKEKLNRQQPGEQTVIIAPSTNTETTPTNARSAAAAAETNPQAWWAYLFGGAQ